VVVLDAYALVAVLAQEPAALKVEAVLHAERACVSTVNLAETYDVCLRVHRLPPERVRGDLDILLRETVEVVQTSAAEAWRAAELRLAHYDRRTRPVSIADCMLLAHAGPEDSVATADPHVAAVARAEGVGLTPLPDSRGRLP